MTRIDGITPATRMAAPGEAEVLLDLVFARAQRRLAWLSGPGQGGPGADRPEAEARWQASDPEGLALSAQVTAAERQLEGRPGLLANLSRIFQLGPGERDLLLTALAAWLEPSLSAIFMQLTGRAWVSEALVQRLFGYGMTPIWDPGGRLAAWHLIHAGAPAPGDPVPLTADPVLAFWLAGDFRPDRVLARAARPVRRPDPVPSVWPVDGTSRRIGEAFADRHPVRLIVRGAEGSGRAAFACAVAEKLGLSARLYGVPEDRDLGATVWMLAQRHALVAGTMPVWAASPALPPQIPPAPLNAVIAVPGDPPSRDPMAGDVTVDLPVAGTEDRRAVLAHSVPTSRTWPQATRRRLVEGRGATLADLMALPPFATGDEAVAELGAAAAVRLGDMAVRVETGPDWDDLVLPDGLTDALRDLAFEARRRGSFWLSEGVRRHFPRGRGLTALFSGPSGTGKTMAAQVIARDLGVELFRLDLASVTSKYIGETARNLRDLFRRAEGMDAVLLFDEADALFATRTEVKDSRDRYANADTNYLLQQLEAFEGIAILATNKKANIDTAFLRRLRYVFDFPRADAPARRRLWHRLAEPVLGIEPDAALGRSLDRLADALELSGAQIKGALLAARFAAERREAQPAMRDLLRGIERELAKEGRVLTPADRRRLSGDG